MLKWFGVGAIALSVLGMYYVGKNEVDKKPLSIYDLAYEIKSQDNSPQSYLKTESDEQNLKMKEKWKAFNSKLSSLSQESFISSLTALNGEHKYLMNLSLKEGYALDPLEVTPPTLRWVAAKTLKVELGSLDSYHILKLESQKDLWRDLQTKSSNLRYLASTN